jgi:hypothetical protein
MFFFNLFFCIVNSALKASITISNLILYSFFRVFDDFLDQHERMTAFQVFLIEMKKKTREYTQVNIKLKAQKLRSTPLDHHQIRWKNFTDCYQHSRHV